MRNADRGEASRLDGRELRIAIVQARFNAELTDRIARACADELAALGVGAGDVTHVRVPGALEIGTALNALADADEHDALVAVGCVLRGETYHFELVANESGSAVTIGYALSFTLPKNSSRYVLFCPPRDTTLRDSVPLRAAAGWACRPPQSLAHRRSPRLTFRAESTSLRMTP